MAIRFNREFTPDYGQVVELAPSIRRVVAKNPNPFTFTGTGVYVLGRGKVAIVDPGPSLDDHLDSVLAALEPGEQVTHILVTHTHTDHTAGVAKLKARTGATTYGFGPHGPVPEHDPLESISFDEYFTAEEKAEFDKAWDDTPDELKREGPDTEFVPDVALADGDRVEAETWAVEAVHTPGHTSNHLCFRLFGDGGSGGGSDETVLFTGDHVMGWATSVISPPDGDLFDYMNSLDKLLTVNDARYWPTHGAPIENPHEYVRSFITHRNHREAQIVAALEAGPTTIKAIVPNLYADTDKRLWRAAANSVFAHLVALHRQTRATPLSDDGQPTTPTLTATWTLT